MKYILLLVIMGLFCLSLPRVEQPVISTYESEWEPEYTPEEFHPAAVKEVTKHPIDTLTIVNTNRRVKYKNIDKFCLAKNIYHEARGEDLIGQLAVAQVTLNRVISPYYPNDICHVVMQYRQFSWANSKSLRWSHPSGEAWDSAKHLTTQILDHGLRVKGLETALYYHADYVKPKWRDKDAILAQVGTHIFYERAKPL